MSAESQLPEFQHAKTIARYIRAGRLSALILENIKAGVVDLSKYDGPPPHDLELSRPLSTQETAVAIGFINGDTYDQLGASLLPPLRKAAAYERLHAVREAIGLVGLPKARNAQIPRHLFGLGVAIPDEEPPIVGPTHDPDMVFLGLLSHGSTTAEAQQITDMSAQYATLRVYRQLRNDIHEPRAAVTRAFDSGIFSLRPDQVLPPDYLTHCVPQLIHTSRIIRPEL